MAPIDDSPSKTLFQENGFADRERDAVQLFDLILDPAERNNLADDPDYAAVKTDLTRRLQDWMEQTNDPLLNGPVPKPEGSRINLRSQYSPREKSV